MKSKSKRLLSLLFSLAVMLVLVAAPVYAEGDVTEDTSTDTTEDSVVAEVLYASGTQLGTYSTFEDAVNAASTGQTVRLLSDYTLTTAFDYGRAQQITIDLNGHTISAGSDVVSSTYGAVIALSYNGQWTIKDSSETQTGKIEVSGSAAAKMLFYNRGTIILESGSLNFLDYSGTSSNPAVITNQYASYASGTFIMTGGTLTFSTTTGSFAYAVVNNNTNTTSPAVSISGGTINVPKGKWGTSVFSFADGSNYSITGGTFTTDPSDYVANGYVAVENADGTYTVTECVYLGVSADDTASVPAVVVSGAGTNTVVAKVSGAYVGTDGVYSTSSYPTTSMTYTSADSNDSGTYIFAGWYTDEDCTTACDASMWTDSTEAYYYAKFVDANALKVACVFTPASITGSGNAWRFVSSWASTDANALLFVVNGTESSVSTYYGSYLVGTNTFYPSDFSSASLKVSSYGIVEDEGVAPLASYSVQTGWLTLDGTKIYGGTYIFDMPIGATTQTVLSTDEEAVVVELGISSSEATVPATVVSGLGTSTVYVEVSGEYVGTDGYYSTSSYPTTSLTHTPSADTNDSGSYIFAGWYTSNDGVSLTACTSSMWESVSSETNYYALFVDANALQVACVFTPASITGSGNAWRFVSSWVSTEQSALLFVIDENEYSVGTYYGSYKIGNDIIFYPSDFSSVSVKVSSYGFVETSSDLSTESCTVLAGWLTQDGTKVYGKECVFNAPENATEQVVLSVIDD